MSESELLKRIFELEAENLALISENERLRKELGLSEKEVVQGQKIIDIEEKPIPEAPSLINKYSSPEEKIELFMSLFCGRTDVYAKRCYSKKHGNSYYIPACKNEWARGVCDKTRTKCKDCSKRELLSLTKEVIDSHLRNKDENGTGIIGVYPLLPDETCLFLAVDFDEENWQKDISVFRLVCKDLNIPAAIERSRSGNGAHAWLFFETPVTAIAARKLGNALLTEAMSARHEIKFTSYDRMFPNQDFMPKGGFGNLIALPLQGGARKNGNSEFIDENFQSYPDQWAYLVSIRKLNSEEIKNLLSELCEGNELGELSNTETNDEDSIKPWKSKSLEIKLECNDFPEQLTIVEANRLYIPKRDVSQRALNRIKRLAAFSNPQFYKTQKMRMSTGIIDIAIVQSLIHDNEINDIVKNYGMVIVDECHHASSLNYEKVLGEINAKYVYGLTATPIRQDGQHPITFMQCGSIRYSVDAKSQASKRDFEHFIIPRFTQFKKPFTQNETDWHITKIYTALAEDEYRNQQIVTDIIGAVNEHRTSIVLTQRKEHVVRLFDMLKNQTDAHIK
jgi:hypothetical protein